MGNKLRLRKVMTVAALAAAMALFGACGDTGGDVQDGNGTAESQEGGNGEQEEDTAADSGGQEDAGTGENDGAAGNTQTDGTVPESGRREYGPDAYLSGIRASDYVNLGEYKGIAVTQAPPEVTDEYRDSYIDYLLCIDPNRGVIEGDTVNIDYAGTLDGVPFEGGTASGQELLIGSGRFVPGFEEGLLGAKTGETVEVPLTFPENYHEELAGKDVVFTVTINSIMAQEPQELTDEYVKGLDIGLSTVEEYRQYAYDALYEDALETYEMQVEDAALGIAFERCEFTKEPPEEMVERHMEILTSNLSMQAAGYGMTLSQLMEMYGMDEAAYQEEFRSQAVEYVRQQIMIQAIADAEGLRVSEEEYRGELEGLLEGSAFGTVAELEEALDGEGYREYMLSQKVLGFLRENAVVTENAEEQP